MEDAIWWNNSQAMYFRMHSHSVMGIRLRIIELIIERYQNS